MQGRHLPGRWGLGSCELEQSRWPRASQGGPRCSFLGAEDDAIFSPAEIRRTGLGYGAETEIVPGIAHDMMLDTRWEAVAERIAQWLDEQYSQK